MQTKLNKSKKIILDTRHESKANKTGFTILSLSSKKFYIKPPFGQQERNRNKTITTSKKTCEKVVPLKTTPHKESKKICFGIVRAIHK